MFRKNYIYKGPIGIKIPYNSYIFKTSYSLTFSILIAKYYNLKLKYESKIHDILVLINRYLRKIYRPYSFQI